MSVSFGNDNDTNNTKNTIATKTGIKSENKELFNKIKERLVIINKNNIKSVNQSIKEMDKLKIKASKIDHDLNESIAKINKVDKNQFLQLSTRSTRDSTVDNKLEKLEKINFEIKKRHQRSVSNIKKGIFLLKQSSKHSRRS